MWIRREQYERMCARIDAHAALLRSLDRHLYVNGDGLLTDWSGQGFTLIQALNAMAEAQGFRWRETGPVEGKLRATPVGKSAVNEEKR